MSRKSRFDVPPKVLTWLDKLPGNPWEEFDKDYVVDVDDEPVEWLSAEADPNASFWFFIKKRAVAIAAGGKAVSEAAKATAGYPAAAYEYGGYAHVRRVRDSFTGGFGFYPSKAHGLWRGLLFDEGKNDFAVQMGYWLPDEKRLVVPNGAKIVGQHLNKKDLPEEYRHLPQV